MIHPAETMSGQQESEAMKTFLGILILIFVLGLTAGCHSGTVRGVGSDISNLGDSMQK